LQDVVEDAEDLLDEIEYDALKLKVETESEFDDKFKVSKLSSIFNSIDRKRKTDMEKILERLNTFKEERYILDLRTNVEKIQSQRTPSMSSIDDAESKRYGTGVFETVNCFVMHDLMVDLANFVSKKKILYLEKDKVYDIGIVKQLRHVGFDMVNCQNLHEIYKLVSDATCLRTIMPVTRNLFATERLQEDVSKDIRKLKHSNLHCPILTQLWLVSCEKLKFLPEKLPSLLPSLQELAIYGCPELESLPKCGLPFSLSMLTISNCNKLIASRKNWKLQTLPNLTFFRIEDYQCEDMESLLEQGMLPPSITSLEIVKVACLKSLDHKGFQEIESLKELYISECPKLQSLPVKGLPPAFEGLLPPSFETFFMNYCPLLEEKYEWEYNSDDHKGWMMIRCITRPQDVSSQQPLIKPFLRLIGPKAVRKSWTQMLSPSEQNETLDAANTSDDRNEAELVDEIVNFIRRKMDEAIIDLNKRKSGPPVSVSVDFLLKKISSGVVRFLRGKNDSDFRCDAIEKVGLDFYGTSSSKLFPLLESLTFKKMKNWKEWSMPKENVESFSKLKSLTIHECERLAGDLPCILPSLKELEISYCPMIASPLPVLPNVSRVSVMQCAKIVGFKSCSNLEDLCLKNCYKLHFPLTSNYKSLQKLSVENISSSFKLLPLDSLPNIMNVRVCNCENLESFSLLNSLNSLYTLSIEECPNFTLLPDSNLDCPILTKLVIYSCDKLRFLPEKLPNLLPSLMVLVIDDCPELESIARSGLPFSLRELTIRNCNKLIASRKNWNLQILPSLGSFCIGDYECDDMESFLEQGSLPTSLTSLTIEDVAYLKTLDENGFQELKSLKELHMSRCPKLQSLPVKGLPPSFNGLLPPSFETFFMNDCPLLEANYEWEEGNDLGGKICCIPVKPQESQALEPSSLELVSTKNTKGLGRAPTEIYVVKVHCDGHPDDGFSWKQYGQKNILGAKYPRGYYSCTYRHSKGCLAKKILQRLDDDPRMVEVKYSGKHTCTNDVGHVIGSSTDDHTFSPMSSITADDLVYWDDLL
ncbi:hypothetical protein F8388_024241, partial [Cannabis sativa]